MTNTEILTIWNHLQTSYVPALRSARYSFKDNIEHIRKNSKFYKHEIKQAINKIEKDLDLLCNRAINIDADHINWINIFSDNVDEIVEFDVSILENSIRMAFQKRLLEKDLDFFVALHTIDYMLIVARILYNTSCEELTKYAGINSENSSIAEDFSNLDVSSIQESWEKICNLSIKYLPKNSKGKLVGEVNLNTTMHNNAVDCLCKKFSSIDTLRTVAEKSYPYSPRYCKRIPYEESRDYAMFHGGKTLSGKVFPIAKKKDDYFCICCGERLTKEEFIKYEHKCKKCAS